MHGSELSSGRILLKHSVEFRLEKKMKKCEEKKCEKSEKKKTSKFDPTKGESNIPCYQGDLLPF